MPFLPTHRTARPKQLFSRLSFDVIIPPLCILCRNSVSEQRLCPDCWKGLVMITAPLCSVCGLPLAHDILLSDDDPVLCAPCLIERPPLNRIRAVCVYNETSRQILLPFKHAGRLDRTVLIAQMMRPVFSSLISTDMLVIPMPLHWRRYLFRLYNQSAELSRRLCDDTHHSYNFTPRLLHRHKHTPAMMTMTKARRNQDVRNAFTVSSQAPSGWQERDILIIDDVMTTGASLYEAAKTLRKAGHKAQISGLVFARVLTT